jgi:hypothetical protein
MGFTGMRHGVTETLSEQFCLLCNFNWLQYILKDCLGTSVVIFWICYQMCLDVPFISYSMGTNGIRVIC